MKRISTSKAPAAIGPYSQGFVAGDFLFTSGQGGLNPVDGTVVEGGIKAQAEQIIKNLGELFKESGTDFTKWLRQLAFLRICQTLKRLTQFMNSILQKNLQELVSQ